MKANFTVRKFIDLIYSVSGKWTNWDPPVPITVGDYGTLDKDGELVVEGNIYRPDFQKKLDESKFNLDLSLKTNQPALGDPEQDYIVASTGVKRGSLDVNQNINVPGIASASIKGTWKFKDGERGALVILHNPRQAYIPLSVQSEILRAKPLEGKYIVMTALACPAYLLYLSDKSGQSVSIALRGQALASDALTSEIGFGWWTDNESALLRRGFNPKGEDHFTPLFSLREKVKRRWFPWRRAEDEAEPPEEYEWKEVHPLWKPLDEDGKEIAG